jgi:hypothetical protein
MVIRDFWVRDRVRVMVRGRGMVSDTCELITVPSGMEI